LLVRGDVERWVRRLFDAYERGEPARVGALLADDVVIHAIDGRELRGREDAAEYYRGSQGDSASRTVLTTHAVIGQDDCVLVVGRRRTSASRGHSDRPAAWVMRFTDEGLLAESAAFASRVEAERMYPVLCENAA
jgi:ketosteroid isomerase-like protein